MSQKPDTPGETCGYISHWVLGKVKPGREKPEVEREAKIGRWRLGEMVEAARSRYPRTYHPLCIFHCLLFARHPPPHRLPRGQNVLNTSLATVLFQGYTRVLNWRNLIENFYSVSGGKPLFLLPEGNKSVCSGRKGGQPTDCCLPTRM